MVVFTDGTEISAKILEVGTSTITYKNATNLDGPSYVIEKNKVFLIKYENGTVEKFPENLENNSSGENQKAKNPLNTNLSISFKSGIDKLVFNDDRYSIINKMKFSFGCELLYGITFSDLNIAVGLSFLQISSKNEIAFSYSYRDKYICSGNVNNIGIPINLSYSVGKKPVSFSCRVTPFYSFANISRDVFYNNEFVFQDEITVTDPPFGVSSGLSVSIPAYRFNNNLIQVGYFFDGSIYNPNVWLSSKFFTTGIFAGIIFS